MRITLTAPNALALAALSFLMQETHELAHTSVGRLICGCWGRRDFNVWGLCRDCASGPPLTVWATFAGPAYSFSVIWLGYYLLTRASAPIKSLGFALIVSSMPFSRILTPLFGGGDEVFAMRTLGIARAVAWPIALLLVLALAIPPVVKIYRTIENPRKPLWIAGLLLVPFLLVGAVVFGLLQGLMLRNGVLSEYGILGSPMLVSVWQCVVIGWLAVLGRHLGTLLRAS
ncbi:MAG TPA: hypothetical protein VFV75_11920 [Candidatus Polarisedimenticolaceae bacterium]|nr:hypothetical protein [Candidatus Polarisedimenticolaceae bacterium]